MSFQFGSTPNKTAGAGGFTMSTPTAAVGSTAGTPSAGTPGFGGGLALGAGDSKSSTNLSFTPLATTTASATITTATTPAAQKPLGFSFTPSSSVSTPSLSGGTGTTGFGLPITSTSTPLAAVAATPAPASATASLTPLAGSLFSSAAQSASTPSIKLGATPTVTAATTTIASVSQAQPTVAQTTPATSLVTSTTVTSSAPVSIALGNMNYVQLEEVINKWTMELEEQEKMFVNQATQINAWDRLLIDNSEKIAELNHSVENAKLQQQQLDYELDFILGQQRELEECLVPLEKQLISTPVNIDPQRENMYHMAESMDTQLKQMSEDLKEIIEHLNESSKTQDNNDPIVQIGRILNAHMNSLQWIDEHILQIQNRLDEVCKLHDLHRRENERSFRLTYE